MEFLIISLTAYLIGSISFAVIIGYIFKGIDIRTKGSGNAGATNVKRVLGFKLGVLVMILDFMKGLIPVLILGNLGLSINLEISKIIVLLSIILGHIFPIWFKFKGGKGVASAAGGITAIFPPVFPFSITIFVITFYVSKHVSLASIVSAWTLPIFYYLYTVLTKTNISYINLAFFISITFIITITHRSNIKRLYRGNET